MTLSQEDLRATTTVCCSAKFPEDQLVLNGKIEPLTSQRSQSCLTELRRQRKLVEESDESLPKLSSEPLRIVSVNNFPTAAGLASSAAGYAALVYAVAKLYQLPADRSELSKIARLGSGSACRSLFGGFVAWEMGMFNNGSDSKAVQLAEESQWPGIRAAILVVSAAKKEVPSTGGMQQTVQTSDLFVERVVRIVPKRFITMTDTIYRRDFDKFAELTMKDSNSFHAVCLDTFPPIFYMNDTSKRIIKIVNLINEAAGKNIAAYTFDAGPNAVIYYEVENEQTILGTLHHFFGAVDGWKKEYKTSLADSIAALDQETFSQGVSRVILTKIGDGAKETSEVLIDIETGEPL